MHEAARTARVAACLAPALLAVAPAPATSASSSPFPLVRVTDVDLPGRAVRFDYQDVDARRGHLVIAHMSDDSVVVVRLKDGSVVKVLPGIRTPRGVAVADEAARIFVTSMPRELVIIDATTLTEIGRVATGQSPDGVGWDPVHRVVGVSDQGDGAVSLIGDAGSGERRQVPLGVETGNVVFDPGRGQFWVTVVMAAPPDRLVAIDPVAARVATRIDLPGCRGAHGLRIHPDGQSALVACEGSSVLARVGLGTPSLVTAKVGRLPDVLAIDPGAGWLYVAAESGDLVVFDLGKQGLVRVDSEHVGDAAHSVAVDASTHRVFFPLKAGRHGKPVLRIMRPAGP